MKRSRRIFSRCFCCRLFIGFDVCCSRSLSFEKKLVKKILKVILLLLERPHVKAYTQRSYVKIRFSRKICGRGEVSEGNKTEICNFVFLLQRLQQNPVMKAQESLAVSAPAVL